VKRDVKSQVNFDAFIRRAERAKNGLCSNAP
jgi:hypothetical protein